MSFPAPDAGDLACSPTSRTAARGKLSFTGMAAISA